MKRVVITGIGVISPIGNNVEDFTKNLFAGKSGIGYITKFDTSSYRTRIAGEVKDFNPEPVINRKETRRMDTVSQYALVAANEAVKMANFDMNAINKERCGVIIATGIGGMETWEKQHSVLLNEGVDRLSPFFVPMMMINSPSGQVAIKFG
ncbi:MAG: beta-ketoacyl-[acyl-carrier-protein] synthase II, partial [bacterium (Candidatus Stahlbacteria) CG23_combo_of_CG06-09_8_20_14_all_34_7]